jgi:hypothetical protein
MDWQKDIADSVFSMYILNKLNDDDLLNPKKKTTDFCPRHKNL